MDLVRRNLVLCLLVGCMSSGCGLNTAVLKTGGTGLHGTLLNYSCGARPCDPIDPAKPTIVITHGMNPLPKLIHTSLGRAGAKAIKCRCGDTYNILSWDWNAVRVSPFPRSAERIGKEQGRMMAAALQRRGVDPMRTQIIAHSLGTLVAAQATVCLSNQGPLAQVTLLDAPKLLHRQIFEELAITRHAYSVENYWAPGISGFGASVQCRGVQNYKVEGTRPVRGIFDLSVSNHVNVMRWYHQSMVDASIPCGFQRSVLLGYCGTQCSTCSPAQEEIILPTLKE